MTNARDLAATVLYQIQRDDHTVDLLVTKLDQQIQRLKRADRGLFNALVFGVLRWQGRLDWVLDHLTSRPGKKIDPLVRVILRMGLFQICCLDRIPVSAAVNTSVELAKKKRRKWASGFVNGVLRKAADKEINIPWPDRRKKPLDYLSIHHAFPRWLIARWVDHWGMDETEAMCQTINTIPAITIRTNTLSIQRRNLTEHIRNYTRGVNMTRHSPEGISFTSPDRPIAQWEAFANGWFQVQSEASQCIAHLLSVQPGHRVWDTCAGLGTKTAHIGQLMDNDGHILATDISEKKLNQLTAEMHRLGISIVEPLRLDLVQPPTGLQPDQFDRILIDAPCSGLGVLQKNPDGKWRNSLKKIEDNAKRQQKLLDNCAPYLKPGGFMVYAVCSIEPEENEQVVEGFLQKHPEFAIERQTCEKHQLMKAFLTPEGYIRTNPKDHQMDGFFAAILNRI